MAKLVRRVQIRLDEPRYRLVAGEAQRRRVSLATVIRGAIDQMTAGAEKRRNAVTGILGAEPMSLPPNPAELRRELDAAHARLFRDSPQP